MGFGMTVDVKVSMADGRKNCIERAQISRRVMELLRMVVTVSGHTALYDRSTWHHPGLRYRNPLAHTETTHKWVGVKG